MDALIEFSRGLGVVEKGVIVSVLLILDVRYVKGVNMEKI